MKNKTKGWRGDSYRHSLSSRGIPNKPLEERYEDHKRRRIGELRQREEGIDLDEIMEQNKPMTTYNGFPLTYEYTTRSYDILGNRGRDVRVGRDSDGKLCVEDGKFEHGSMIDGEPIYFYKIKTGEILGIKK